MDARSVIHALLGVMSLYFAAGPGCAGPSDAADPGPQPAAQPAPAPDPGSSVTALPATEDRQPPPISGGTLLLLRDGHTAVASDPDRDRVWIVDIAKHSLLHEVRLQPGDEPGRLAEDQAGRVHLVLRRGGALLSIDPQSGAILLRTPVCPAPRGLAYDPVWDQLHVACADGRLVSFLSGSAIGTVQLDGDLRDVVVQDDRIYVTRFRSAEVLEIGKGGTLLKRITLPATGGKDVSHSDEPSVAWRGVPLPLGGMALLHQRAQRDPLKDEYYDERVLSRCAGTGIVNDAVSIVEEGWTLANSSGLAKTALAVDLAISADGKKLAVAAPGMAAGQTVSLFDMSDVKNEKLCVEPTAQYSLPGAIAVAFDPQGNTVVQTREPAALHLLPAGVRIDLPGRSVANAGHALFHTATRRFVACASCHAEAGDDGRVWQFAGVGPRRTQHLRGGVLSRTPFHWAGDIADLRQLVLDTFVIRMRGEQPEPAVISALGRWLDAQPALRAPEPADAAAVARGSQIFHDAGVGCAGCHSGPQLTTREMMDVGTGYNFKVPSLLGVGYRAPYLHDGCAPTLRERFTVPECGGGAKHGHTQQLDAGQLDDLIAYLKTL